MEFYFTFLFIIFNQQNLMKLYGRQESVLADLRAKLKTLRHDSAAKEKQLELAHRTIERLAVDKHGLEAGAAAKKTYIKQLESRVSALKEAEELRAQNARLQEEVLALRKDAQLSKQQTEAAQEEAAAQAEEIALLRRSIQIASEQLSRSAAGTQISDDLLIAVAHGRNEASALSLRLADSQTELADMSEALTAARSHLETQHDALRQWQEWEILQSAKFRELEGEILSARAERDTLRVRVEELAGGLLAERTRETSAKRQAELERTAKEDAQERVRALESALKEAKHKIKVLEERKHEPFDSTERPKVELPKISHVGPDAPPPSGVGNTNPAFQPPGALSPPKPRSRPPQAPVAICDVATLDSKIVELEKELDGFIHPDEDHAKPAEASIANVSKARNSQQIALDGAPAVPTSWRQEAFNSSMEATDDRNEVRNPISNSIDDVMVSSPERRILAAGGKWRTNPLASPRLRHPSNRDPTQQEDDDKLEPLHDSEEYDGELVHVFGDDDAIWDALQQRLDALHDPGQGGAMMSTWQRQPLGTPHTSEDSLRGGQSSIETTTTGADSIGGVSPEAESTKLPYVQHPKLTTAATKLKVQIPNDPRGTSNALGHAVPSPGIASSRVLSPALGRLLATDTADWLSGPSETAVPQKALSNSNLEIKQGGGSANVIGKENVLSVRHSLFDLARLQLDDFTHM